VESDWVQLRDHGYIIGRPHLGNLRRALRLHRYERLRSCFVADLGDEITTSGSIFLAPARPTDLKGKLFYSLARKKMDKREGAIS